MKQQPRLRAEKAYSEGLLVGLASRVWNRKKRTTSSVAKQIDVDWATRIGVELAVAILTVVFLLS